MPDNIYDLLTPVEDNSDKFFTLQRQIDNILNSYDDMFDAFSELIQNSFDAVLRRLSEAPEDYFPKISIQIDCVHNRVTVTDNGCGVQEEHFNKVLRPNTSLKKELRHREARGEKGAAVSFLQFGHNHFEFHTKRDGFSKRYELSRGRLWFEGFSRTMEEAEEPVVEGDLPVADITVGGDVSPDLDAFEAGSVAVVEFGQGTNLRSLADLTGTNVEVGFRRWEYVLRTRTAIGYVHTTPDPNRFDEIAKKLEATLEVTIDGATSKRDRITVGFFYPHEQAQKYGRKASLMTNPIAKSALLYEYLTPDFFANHLTNFLANDEYRAVYDRYEVRGYVSYVFANQLYEDLVKEYCAITDDDPRLLDAFLQTNGGFAVAVREYPNGKIRTFLHRSGAEDKSRTYVMLDFRGDYKPDYGRKNLKNDARGFVMELCKQLISFSTKPDRKNKLQSNTQTTPHGTHDLRAVQLELARNAQSARARGKLLDSSSDPINFLREPRMEDEVIFIFFELVRKGILPGYQFYELNDDGSMLDTLFDFEAPQNSSFIYNKDNNPLGLIYPDFNTIQYENQWLEFKTASELLIDDFKKQVGAQGKKWFTTVNLLVCQTVDDATDDYEIKELDDDSAGERQYFGVTHLMASPVDQSHSIQVISLKTLRDRYQLWR